jgi:hypothetical protein
MKCVRCKEPVKAIAKDWFYLGKWPICTKCVLEECARKKLAIKERVKIIRSWTCSDLTDYR